MDCIPMIYLALVLADTKTWQTLCAVVPVAEVKKTKEPMLRSWQDMAFCADHTGCAADCSPFGPPQNSESAPFETFCKDTRQQTYS